jgi:hypothetical protein
MDFLLLATKITKNKVIKVTNCEIGALNEFA